VTTVDARGLECPLPLVMAKTALESVAPGEAITVLATDPEAALDLAAFAADEGHAFEELPASAGVSELVLRKSSPA
jgi:tRNA 2-thiouridine synthesizing protein A